jgi:hypothetical protein
LWARRLEELGGAELCIERTVLRGLKAEEEVMLEVSLQYAILQLVGLCWGEEGRVQQNVMELVVLRRMGTLDPSPRV